MSILPRTCAKSRLRRFLHTSNEILPICFGSLRILRGKNSFANGRYQKINIFKDQWQKSRPCPERPGTVCERWFLLGHFLHTSNGFLLKMQCCTIQMAPQKHDFVTRLERGSTRNFMIFVLVEPRKVPPRDVASSMLTFALKPHGSHNSARQTPKPSKKHKEHVGFFERWRIDKEVPPNHQILTSLNRYKTMVWI